MKTIRKSISLLFILISSFSLKAQWQMLSPIVDNTLTHVSFASDSLGIVVEYDNTNPPPSSRLFRTTNMGLSWDTLQTLPTGAYATEISFVDPENLYVGVAIQNSAMVLRSSNAGDSWTDVTPASIDSNDINSIKQFQFIDNQLGFFVGEAPGLMNIVYRTLDGGDTWTQISSSLYNVTSFFVDAVNGFFGGFDDTFLYRGRIMQTTDGGATIDTIFLDQYNSGIPTINFPNDSIGYCASAMGIFKTTNGGQSWDTLPFDSSANIYWVSSITFTDNNTGYLFTYDKVYKTTDGAQSWTLDLQEDTIGLYDFDYRNNTGWIVGYGGIIMRRSIFNGLDEPSIKTNPVRMFPNPAGNQVNFEVKAIDLKDAQLNLVDCLGRVIRTIDITSNQTSMDISELKEGMYFWNFFNSQKLVTTGKLIKVSGS